MTKAPAQTWKCGHERTEENTAYGTCRTCRLERARQWRKDNPERTREIARLANERRRRNGKAREYIDSNKEKYAGYARKKRESLTPEQLDELKAKSRERTRKYYAEHRDEILAKAARRAMNKKLEKMAASK